ncbi:MAG: alpha/beta fold hydrolase [Planctomycetota bacterium]|nr:alpha/beta fold hydrolase [Planctomycetota bacterium]
MSPSDSSPRPSVLGHSITLSDSGEHFQLMEGEEQIFEGSLEECERVLAKRLLERFGEGRPNVALPTLGGLQLWADVFWRGGWRIQEHVYAGHFRLISPDRVREAWGTWEECRSVFEGVRISGDLPPAREKLVVVLHGLGRAGGSFGSMEEKLEAAGFDVATLVYPSTRRSLSEHAHQLAHLLDRIEEAKEVSFVTHSLGGLVARTLLAREGDAWREGMQLGRVVMLAPPSHGSVVAETLKDFMPFEWLAGPSGQDVTASGVETSQLPVPPCEFGVIAGGKNNDRGWNPLLEGDDDGVVTVEETRLPGLTDFLLVERAHTFIMRAPEVVGATVRFLLAGKFQAAGD